MNDQDIDKELEILAADAKKTQKRTHSSSEKGERKIVFDSGLTPQQEAYCRGRALGMSKKEAVSMAGLELNSTNRAWDRLPAVQKRIQQLSEIVTENSIIKNGLDRGWVISRLMTVAERCMQAEPVLDRKGQPTGEFTFDSSGANRALELLGKTMRMFEAKEATKNDEYANLSDDEIARIAAELATQTGLAGYLGGAETTAGSQQVIEVQAIPKAD